jgi:hypothetical protein
VPRLKGDQHVSTFTLRRMTGLLRNAGFDVERAGTFNGLWPFALVAGKRLAQAVRVLEEAVNWPGNLLFVKATKQPSPVNS